MPASPIYQAFVRAFCVEMSVSTTLLLSKSRLERIRDILKGKRIHLPYRFAFAYPGEGKTRIGASADLRRLAKNKFFFGVRWFPVDVEPPPDYGSLPKLLSTLNDKNAERQLEVVVTFAYEKEKVESLFRPIQMADHALIFDEIVGLTGVKRSPEGKLIYQMEVRMGGKTIRHVVRFTQAARLEEQSPLFLLDSAEKISALALKPKEGK
jgi:hypothetical protein